MSGVSRAFTTRRSKKQELSAPGPQRSASTRAAFNIRSKISGPVELISTTNMLSYNAPDLYPSPSPSSENDSESSRGNLTSPPTSPDSSSIGSVPGSPEPNHLSAYFNNAPDQYQQQYQVKRGSEEPPAVPSRSLSHTKSNHEMVHRHRSQRQSSSKNSISYSNNTDASMNLRKKISSPQMNAGISASINAPSQYQMHSSRRPSITSPPQQPLVSSQQMHSSRQNSMASSRQNSMSSSSRQGSMSSSQSTNLSSYPSSTVGSRQNSMSGSRKNSFTSNRPSSSKSNGQPVQSGNSGTGNVAISRTTMMMFSPTQQASDAPPMPAMPSLSQLPSAALPAIPTLPKTFPKQREQPQAQAPSLPQSPPPNRSLPAPPHPFGKELAQVSELAETYGSKLGVVDEEERDLVSRGFRKFSAQDYINEIQGLFSSAFADVKPAMQAAPSMAWI